MAVPFIQQEAWARLVLGISVAAFAAGELTQTFKRRRNASRTDLRGELTFRVIFGAGALMLPLSHALAPGAVLEGRWAFVLGVTVGWLGLLLRWWSFVSLGEYFTTVVRTSADQPVVTRGPYRFLRHPSYTGLLAAFLGVGLMLGNSVGVIASFVLTLVGLVYRLEREERALLDALGDAYADFARGRARLIPFVW